MSKFGWSYPPGAANDPFAPYNQEFDDEHCVYCGKDLPDDVTGFLEIDEVAVDDGYCNAKCEKDYEDNGYQVSDNYGKPNPTDEQLETIKWIHNEIYKWKRDHVRKVITLDEFLDIFPKKGFTWDDAATSDGHAYCCGEKDCPVQWHLAYYMVNASRVDDKLTVEAMSGDEDGNWDLDATWEEGDNLDEISWHFGGESMNEYFMGWTEYWLDAATSGKDPCNQVMETPESWVAFCIAGAHNNLKYLKMKR